MLQLGRQSCLLVILVVASLNAEIWNEAPKKLSFGKEYEFAYDAQIVTGMPTSSWHYTGYRLQARVSLRSLSQDARGVELKLDQIRFLHLNREIPVEEPSDIFLPLDLFQELAENQNILMKELVRPLRFQWKNGVVSRLQVESDDQFWSVNLKKGLLNMLNMDLSTRGEEERATWNGAYRQSGYEEGIDGRCRAVYHWNRLPVATTFEQTQQEQKSIAMNLVKTRDFMDCLDSVGFEHALFLNKDCDEQRKNMSRNMIRSEATLRANLTYWPESKEYFLWEAKTSARYTFAPINAKLGSISTFVTQNLTFIQEKQSGKGEQVRDTSTGNFKEEANLRMQVLIPEIMPLKNVTNDLVSSVMKWMTKVSEQLKQNDSSVVASIHKWVKVMRKAPKELLMNVHQQCVKRFNEQPELVHLFHDLLPTVATKEALETFLEIILTTAPTSGMTERSREQLMSDASLARRVRSFAFVSHVVHPEMLHLMIRAVESRVLQMNRQRRETMKALIMTLGTLTNTHLYRVYHANKPTALRQDDSVDELKERVLRLFQKLLERDIPNIHKEEKIIVVLKALGNAGIYRSLPLLKKLLLSSRSTAVKIQCIYSLRNLAPQVPEEVRAIVLPIFFDVSQDAELRIASYLLAMRTRPSRALLDSLVESVKREPVKQVQAFVISHMKNLASAPCRCDCQVVRNISHILERVPEMATSNQGIQYSHTHHWALTKTESAVLNTGIIFTPDDFLPRSANMRLSAQGNGRETNFLEMGFRTDGLQKMLTKLMGPNGKFFSMNALMKLVKNFEQSDKLYTLSDVNFSLYMKLFGEELGFWAMDEQMKGLLSEGSLGISENIVQFLHSNGANVPFQTQFTHLTDATVRVPTIFGFPFTANMSLVLHAQLKGDVRMKRGILDPQMSHAEVKISPKIFSQGSISAGIDGTMSKAFMRIRVDAHVPKVENLRWDVQYVKQGENSGLRIHMERPQTQWNLLQVNSSIHAIFTEVQEKVNQSTWSLNKIRLPMKYHMEEKDSEENESPEVRQFELKTLGLRVKSQIRIPRQDSVQRRMHFLLQGPMFINISLESMTSGKVQDGIEVRIFKRNAERGNSEDQSMGYSSGSIVVQFLRSVIKPESQSPTENGEENTNQGYPQMLKKLKEVNDNDLNGITGRGQEIVLSQLILQVKPSRDGRNSKKVNISVVWNSPKLMEEWPETQIALNVILSPPKHNIQFQAESPLKVEIPTEEENIFTLKSQLVHNHKIILKYKMSFDMDEVAQRLFQRMSRHLGEYQALHPLIRQCHQDMSNEVTNSPACFFTWRYMNVLNRWNHTILIPKTAPVLLKRIVSNLLVQFMMPNKKSKSSIRILDENELETALSGDLSSPETDSFLHKENAEDKLFKSSIVTSPFDLRLRTIRHLFDTTLTRVPHAVLPAMYFTHLYPGDSMSLYTSLVRYFTERLYPATCYIHNSFQRAIHVQTFDGLLYNLKDNLQSVFGKRIILAQDTQKQMQVSMIPEQQRKTVQIITQDFTTSAPVQLEREYSTNNIRITVNNEQVNIQQNKPFIQKNDNNEVILRVERLEKFVYGGEENLLQVDLPTAGVTLRTDMRTILHIEVSPFFHSTLRGVCGDFDGERRQEIKSVDCKKFYLQPEQIFASQEYVMANSQPSSVNWLSLKSCEKSARLLPTEGTSPRSSAADL